jgi:hypothetical protein
VYLGQVRQVGWQVSGSNCVTVLFLADSHPIGHMGVGDAHLSAIGKLTQLQQVTVKVSHTSALKGHSLTSAMLCLTC